MGLADGKNITNINMERNEAAHLELVGNAAGLHILDGNATETLVANTSHTLDGNTTEIMKRKKKPSRIPTLFDHLSGKLSPKSVDVTWMSDFEFLDSKHNLYNAESGVETPFLPKQFSEIPIYKMLISPDRKYALAMTSKEKGWRHSSIGGYQLMNLDKGIIEKKFFHTNGTLLWLAAWAPSNNSVAYVKEDNNLYIRRVGSNAEVAVTKKGIPGTVYCGRADWLYEEDVLPDGPKAFWWSPESRKLAFAIFNDSRVGEYALNYYGSWKSIMGGEESARYPRVTTVRYPVPGTRNPTVELWVAVLNKDHRIKSRLSIKAPVQLGEHLLTTVKWLNEDTLVVNWMNRVQNQSLTMVCKIKRRAACTNAVRKTEKHGWVDIRMDITPFTDGKIVGFYYLGPTHKKERYTQIFKYERGNSTKVSANAGDVTEIVKITQNGDILYMGIRAKDRKSRHLFRLPKGTKHATCLTCSLEGHSCKYSSVSIRWWICSGKL